MNDRELRKGSLQPNFMNRRPLSVSIIGYLFVAVGVIETGFLIYQLKSAHTFHSDDVWVGLVRLLAILCGIFMLRGGNWARWLAIAWLVFHVGVSAFGSVHQLIVHGLLLAVIAFFLFQRSASQFFRASRDATT
jgi:hypothetical protein